MDFHVDTMLPILCLRKQDLRLSSDLWSISVLSFVFSPFRTKKNGRMIHDGEIGSILGTSATFTWKVAVMLPS